MFLILNHDSIGKRGSFLLESMLAVVIISISLTLITRSLFNSYRVNILNVNYNKALILMGNEFSILTRSGFYQPEALTKFFAEPFAQYHFDVSSEKIDGVDESLDCVHLKTAWSSGKNENGISITTFLFEPPDHEKQK